ncbi:MAG: tetratricopeptide repeat protein [Gemmatimonadaceae bacterium]
MMRSCVVLLAALLACAWQQPADQRAQVRALADAGKLDEAERVARGGGASLQASLGEVLVMRGRLAQADSVFRVALTSDVAGRRTAEAALAELAYRRGDRTEAFRRASVLAGAFENPSGAWSADDRVAAGRAYVILGTRNAAAVRSALAAFDRAVQADSSNLEGRLRVGDLFLEKYNAPDAKNSFQDVLTRSPDNARALLGLARVAEFEGKLESMTLLRRAVAANPSLVSAQVQLARYQLEAEEYDSAKVAARRALAVDSASLPAWSMLGAVAWLKGDSAEYNRAKSAAERLSSLPSDFYAELAEAAIRQRRYVDGMRLARTALGIDSTSTRVLGLLGNNQLHAGNIDEGRALLERAFAIDPFNLWHKNTLDLLDNLRTFTTIDRGHFKIIAPPKEAELLATYLVPLLEEAYDSLSKRYQYKPSASVRLELYRQHADFSVRTVGLAGLGALGVSFGPVLMMDAPSARTKGEFNWGSTAWHELTHTFTLGLSNNRAPRWLSEGLSVLEERRARASWGADATVEFLAAYAGGRLRPVSQLSDGFVRPRFAMEVILSYYEASLVCEMIEQQKGSAALVAMLTAYRDGLDTPAVFAKVLGLKPEEVDKQFDSWVRAKFAVPLRAIAASDGKGEVGGAFVSTMRAGMALMSANQLDSASATFLRAQALFPDYAGQGAPALMLAKIAFDRGDFRGALDQVQRVTSRNETAWDANLLEADLRAKLGDSTGARIPLERMLWISPYDITIHIRLAELASRAGDHATALRERRAVVALDPPDPLDARYQLAKALADAGDVAAARKELLGVLEQAPSFEKAQALLLELSKRGKP